VWKLRFDVLEAFWKGGSCNISFPYHKTKSASKLPYQNSSSCCDGHSFKQVNNPRESLPALLQEVQSTARHLYATVIKLQVAASVSHRCRANTVRFRCLLACDAAKFQRVYWRRVSRRGSGGSRVEQEPSLMEIVIVIGRWSKSVELPTVFACGERNI